MLFICGEGDVGDGRAEWSFEFGAVWCGVVRKKCLAKGLCLAEDETARAGGGEVSGLICDREERCV